MSFYFNCIEIENVNEYETVADKLGVVFECCCGKRNILY